MAADSGNPKSYNLEILTIVNNEGDGADIKSLMIECNIFESISRSFLLGELVIADSVNFLENYKLFGQESLRIKFSQSAGSQDEAHVDDGIDQVFRIYKIEAVTRIDTSSQAYKLLFCSPEMLTSRRKRISQAFRGSMTDIAAKCADDHLNISSTETGKLVPHFEVREASQGDNYQVVIPNWTVGYTINWLCKNAQGIDSTSGLQDSFFFYQTANGGFRIQSLASMMENEYAGGRPFVYIESNANDAKDQPTDKTGSSADEVGMSRRILSYNVGSHADVMKGVVEGMFASSQTTIDNTYKFFIDKTYNFIEKHFSGESSISSHPFVRTTSEMTHIGGSSTDGEEIKIEGVTEENPIGSHSDAYHILASDSSFKFDDKNDIHHADHKTHLGSSQFRNAAKQLLNYYTLNVSLSARTDISTGQLINLDIPAVRPGEEHKQPVFYKGKYLITEIMWNLTPRECNLNIKCMKDSVESQIETTTIDYGETEK
jgi:hypothetical protein